MTPEDTFYYSKLSQLGIEEWLDIPGWEGSYQVSNLGSIRSLSRRVNKRASATGKLQTKATTFFVKGRTMRFSSHKFGHKRVVFRRNDIPETHQVHVLVMRCFVGERPNGHQICHNNGNPEDNCLCNLRYDTPKGNAADKRRHGTNHTAKGEASGSAKLRDDDVRTIRKRYAQGETQKEIWKDYQVGKTTIQAICSRTTWTHIK